MRRFQTLSNRYQENLPVVKHSQVGFPLVSQLPVSFDELLLLIHVPDLALRANKLDLFGHIGPKLSAIIAIMITAAARVVFNLVHF